MHVRELRIQADEVFLHVPVPLKLDELEHITHDELWLTFGNVGAFLDGIKL